MRSVLALILVSLISGCCVSQATTDHIGVQTSAHDGACRLIEESVSRAIPLPGGIVSDAAGPDDVTMAQLEQTPPSVRRLLARSVRFIYEARASWHTLQFTLGDGPDPATLNLSASPAAITSFQ